MSLICLFSAPLAASQSSQSSSFLFLYIGLKKAGDDPMSSSEHTAEPISSMLKSRPCILGGSKAKRWLCVLQSLQPLDKLLHEHLRVIISASLLSLPLTALCTGNMMSTTLYIVLSHIYSFFLFPLVLSLLAQSCFICMVYRLKSRQIKGTEDASRSCPNITNLHEFQRSSWSLSSSKPPFSHLSREVCIYSAWRLNKIKGAWETLPK